MTFYSGFSLQNEEYLFEEYINPSALCVCGFSYGALRAVEEVTQRLKKEKRVDVLQLFSPAFFQSKDAKFKRLQLMSYKKNHDVYMKQFIASCFAPYNQKVVENRATTSQELQELLEYVWDLDVLEAMVKRGVRIEVYLGGKDAIIDANAAREFFLQVATVTYIKDANHFLQLD